MKDKKDEKIKDLIAVLNEKHFDFQGSEVVIRKRKHGIREKPPLYLWDLSRACYISSLIYVKGTTFKFETKRRTETTGTYMLTYNPDETIKIVEK